MTFLNRVRIAQNWGLSLAEVDDLTGTEVTWLNNEQRRINNESRNTG